MSFPSWLGYLLTAVLGGGLLAFVTYHYHSVLAAPEFGTGYVLIPGAPLGMLASAPAAKLGDACSAALEAIVKNGPWSRADVERVLTGTKIYIEPTDAWVDQLGRKVAGLSYSQLNAVSVGPKYEALCHEFGELLYTALEHAEDWQAVDWRGREGLTKAVQAYLLQLPNL